MLITPKSNREQPPPNTFTQVQSTTKATGLERAKYRSKIGTTAGNVKKLKLKMLALDGIAT